MRRALILTALPVEFKSVVAHFSDRKEEEDEDGSIYELGRFTDKSTTWEVIVAEIGKGNIVAGIRTGMAIKRYTPEVALFVGVAGGVKDVELGDVVIATKIYEYDSGKEVGEFLIRPEVTNSSHRLLERAKYERNKEDWLARIIPDVSLRQIANKPKAIDGALAAGGAVITSTKGNIFKKIKKSYGDTIAFEMEGSGFLKAVQTVGGVEALVIRGISDLLSNKSESDAVGYQVIASNHASAFAFHLLAKYKRKDMNSILNQVDLTQSILPSTDIEQFSPAKKKEKIYSNLIYIDSYAKNIWIADSLYANYKDIKNALRQYLNFPQEWCFDNESGKFMSFYNLRDEPLCHVCQVGTIECHDTTEWSLSNDLAKQHQFVELLRKALKEKCKDDFTEHNGGKGKRGYLYYRATQDLSPRIVTYTSTFKKTSKKVFFPYVSKEDSAKTYFYRHFGFENNFYRFNDKWFLAISPIYHFTLDGHNISPLGELLFSKLKRFQKNSSVKGEVIALSEILTDEGKLSLFNDYEFIKLGKIFDFYLQDGIKDEEWKPSKDEEDLTDEYIIQEDAE